MDGGRRHDHDNRDAGCGQPAQSSHDQGEPAEELRDDRQKGEGRGDVQELREAIHRRREALPAEPPEHLLRSVREEDNAEDQAQHGQSRIIGGLYQSSHSSFPFQSGDPKSRLDNH